MATPTEATQSAQPKRPGMTDGVCGEFTVFTDIKPGHADALREELANIMSGVRKDRSVLYEIGTLHEGRHVIFDQDTRYMFASTFDGSWDAYIDDFAQTVVGTHFDRAFGHSEGFPGVKDPDVKEWFVAHQAPANVFATAYPDLTVKQIWKDQRVNEAFQEVLDTPEFQAALENPANAELLATPAFQKLLDVASA
jgi:hypothetical protein